MAYSKVGWTNNVAPYINEGNLGHMDEGIANVDGSLGYDEYDNTQTYNVGAYCIYDNKLYKCTTAVTTAEDFDSSKWAETSVKSLINTNVININTNATNISSLQTKTQNFQTYYNAWGSDITFYLPLGRQAIVIVSQNTLYTVWNPTGAVEWGAVFGSGLTFTRDSSDTTKITGSRSGNATWTVVVF